MTTRFSPDNPDYDRTLKGEDTQPTTRFSPDNPASSIDYKGNDHDNTDNPMDDDNDNGSGGHLEVTIANKDETTEEKMNTAKQTHKNDRIDFLTSIQKPEKRHVNKIKKLYEKGKAEMDEVSTVIDRFFEGKKAPVTPPSDKSGNPPETPDNPGNKVNTAKQTQFDASNLDIDIPTAQEISNQINSNLSGLSNSIQNQLEDIPSSQEIGSMIDNRLDNIDDTVMDQINNIEFPKVPSPNEIAQQVGGYLNLPSPDQIANQIDDVIPNPDIPDLNDLGENIASQIRDLFNTNSNQEREAKPDLKKASLIVGSVGATGIIVYGITKLIK